MLKEMSVSLMALGNNMITLGSQLYGQALSGDEEEVKLGLDILLKLDYALRDEAA